MVVLAQLVEVSLLMLQYTIFLDVPFGFVCANVVYVLDTPFLWPIARVQHSTKRL